MYVMKDFNINNCRLCKKVFCCKTCREKHETVQHNVFTDCEICVYGKTTLGLTSQNVMDHIKTAHWPLHCLFCRRLFTSIEELFQQHKCPDNLSKSTSEYPNTTTHQSSSYKKCYSHYSSEHVSYDNNKVISVLSNLATSTPMQREYYNINLLEKIQQVIITPSDSLSNAKGNDSSSLNLKRKVTFCETPIIESLTKKPKISTDTERSTYYTAIDSSVIDKMENNEIEKGAPAAIVLCNTPDDREDSHSQNGYAPSLVIHTEETVWITTEKFNNMRDQSSIDFHISESKFFTPMLPKKKINVVQPSPVIRKQEQLGIQFEGLVQISSTPNNSLVPIQSVPDARDIFRFSGPSTSKCDIPNWESVETHTDDKFGLTENYKESSNSFNNQEDSVPRKMWTSVAKLVKNVFQGLSISMSEVGASSSAASLKRCYSDQDLQEAPSAKRYKVTDVQCRRNIRNITPIKTYMQSYRQSRSRKLKIKTCKSFADKATQTDDDLFI